jgi:ABC-type nitrate/sulfonate/bicarbonate transport system substrate-binding protein
MTEVLCGIKAHDVHELYCHFLAERLGYYVDEGLKVRVVDVTFVTDDRLPRERYVQVACGAAYLGRREGYPFKVMFAAVQRPMFWLHARPEIERVEDLRGRRVATYPPVAPPHWFSRVLLREHGLDPDRDLDFFPCRDDLIRLGLLRGGDADAALISSATSPTAVQELGFRTLALAGDAIQFVTAGVATLEPILVADRPLIEAVVRAHRRALAALHGQQEEAVAVLAEHVRVPVETARRDFELLHRCYTRAGVPDDGVVEAGVARFDAELPGDETVSPSELYDFSLIEHAVA